MMTSIKYLSNEWLLYLLTSTLRNVVRFYHSSSAGYSFRNQYGSRALGTSGTFFSLYPRFAIELFFFQKGKPLFYWVMSFLNN